MRHRGLQPPLRFHSHQRLPSGNATDTITYTIQVMYAGAKYVFLLSFATLLDKKMVSVEASALPDLNLLLLKIIKLKNGLCLKDC